MKTVLMLCCAVAAMLVLPACVTEDSDVGPQPIRPQGSGGRGASPGYEAETTSAVSKVDRM
jgi:hypothetical protein